MKYLFALTLTVLNLAASETEPPYSGDYEAYVTFNTSSIFGREVTDPAAGADYLFDGQSSDILPFSFSTNGLPTESDADLVFEIMESAEGICGYYPSHCLPFGVACLIQPPSVGTQRFNLASSGSHQIDFTSWLQQLKSSGKILEGVPYVLTAYIAPAGIHSLMSGARVIASLNQEVIGADFGNGVPANCPFPGNFRFAYFETPPTVVDPNLTPDMNVFVDIPGPFVVLQPSSPSPSEWAGPPDDLGEVPYRVSKGIMEGRLANVNVQTDSSIVRREWRIRRVYESVQSTLFIENDVHVETEYQPVEGLPDFFQFGVSKFYPSTRPAMSNTHWTGARVWYELSCVQYNRWGYASNESVLEFHVGRDPLYKFATGSTDPRDDFTFLPYHGSQPNQGVCLLVEHNLNDRDPSWAAPPGCFSQTTYIGDVDPQPDLSIMVKQYSDNLVDIVERPGGSNTLIEELPYIPNQVSIEIRDANDGLDRHYEIADSSTLFLFNSKRWINFPNPTSCSENFHYFRVNDIGLSRFPIRIRYRRQDPIFGWSAWSAEKTISYVQQGQGRVANFAVLQNPPYNAGEPMTLGIESTNPDVGYFRTASWWLVPLDNGAPVYVEGERLGSSFGGSCAISSDNYTTPAFSLSPIVGYSEYLIAVRFVWSDPSISCAQLEADDHIADTSPQGAPLGSLIRLTSQPFVLGEGQSFSVSMSSTGGFGPHIMVDTGTTNIRVSGGFDEQPVSYEWVWTRQGGDWCWDGDSWEVTEDPLDHLELIGDTGFAANWKAVHLSNTVEIKPDPSKAPPFAGVVDDFFTPPPPAASFPASKMNVAVHVRAHFLDGTFLDSSTPDFDVTRLTTDQGIDRVYIEKTQGSITSELSVLSVVDGNQTEVQGYPVVVVPSDTTVQPTFEVYVSLWRDGTSSDLMSCSPGGSPNASTYFSLSTNAENHIVMVPNASFVTLLGSVGHYRLSIDHEGDCPPSNWQHQVSYVVNPADTFAVRVHVRDHIGTSAMSRAYSVHAPIPDLSNVVTIGSLNLFAHPIGYSEYKPYGERVGIGTQDPSDPRYTDHEFDGLSGFNYMKGRFQIPEFGKFNRPDPQRDWNWLAPHTINLYEYVGNDPINKWDPFGLEWFEEIFTNAVSDAKEFMMNLLGDNPGENKPHVRKAKEGLADKFQQEATTFANGMGKGLDFALDVASDTPGDAYSLATGKSMTGAKVSRKAAFVALMLSGVPARGAEEIAERAVKSNLGSRVNAVHEALDPIAQSRRTTAGLDTADGERILASGGRDLSPAQRAALEQGETAAKQPGAHAEVTALDHASASGQKPKELSVSRKICDDCAQEIEKSGGRLTSETTATWDDH